MTRARWPVEHEVLRAELDAQFRSIPYARTMGIELADWGLGWAVTRLAPAAGVRNLVGTVHGGAITGLADVAFEVACNSYGRESVALDLTCHFAAGTSGGPLVAEAEEQSRGRRTASYRISVSDDGRPVAWLLAVAYRTSRWRLGEQRFPPDWRDSY